MKDKKYIRKSFNVHQYEKEEKFLSEMRATGWKFVKLYKGIPTKYEFEQCEPEDYIYQLDYIKTKDDSEDYHQLFSDAGWEEVMSWPGFGGNWYYFCKKKQDEKEERIFTDPESKLELLNRLLLAYGGFFILVILMELNVLIQIINVYQRNEVLFYIDLPLTILACIIMAFLIYSGVSLILLKNKVKRETKCQY